jgi:hypothetical protein
LSNNYKHINFIAAFPRAHAHNLRCLESAL